MKLKEWRVGLMSTLYKMMKKRYITQSYSISTHLINGHMLKIDNILRWLKPHGNINQKQLWLLLMQKEKNLKEKNKNFKKK